MAEVTSEHLENFSIEYQKLSKFLADLPFILDSQDSEGRIEKKFFLSSCFNQQKKSIQNLTEHIIWVHLPKRAI